MELLRSDISKKSFHNSLIRFVMGRDLRRVNTDMLVCTSIKQVLYAIRVIILANFAFVKDSGLYLSKYKVFLVNK